MKSSVFILLIVLLQGCASQDISVSLATDTEQSTLPGGATLISSSIAPAELDALVRKYAFDQQLAYDFSGQKAHVVIPRSREYLADVWYGGELGEQVLNVKVGFNRQVIEHRIDIAVCGTP